MPALRSMGFEPSDPPSTAASAMRRMLSTQVSTVANGVLSSWENPDASMPSEARRWASAILASAWRRIDMSRHTSTTCLTAPESSRIGDERTSSHTISPPGPGRLKNR